MLKKLLLIPFACCIALGAAHAYEGDYYLILSPNSLITARHSELVPSFALHGNHSATRAFYNQLASENKLVNFQPGDRVRVAEYYDDGTAQIIDDNGTVGYIAKADLSRYLGHE